MEEAEITMTSEKWMEPDCHQCLPTALGVPCATRGVHSPPFPKHSLTPMGDRRLGGSGANSPTAKAFVPISWEAF